RPQEQHGGRLRPARPAVREPIPDPAGRGEPVDGLPERDRIRRREGDAILPPARIGPAREVLGHLAPITDRLAAAGPDRTRHLAEGTIPEVESDEGGPDEPLSLDGPRRLRPVADSWAVGFLRRPLGLRRVA